MENRWVHFSASNFLAPYLQQFSIMVPIIKFIGAIGTNMHYISANLALKFKNIMQKQHLLMVLFGTNLVSNISTKASKKVPYFMPV